MRCVKLKAALAERIASLVDRDGVTDILVGGAEGAESVGGADCSVSPRKKFRAEAPLYPAVSGAVRQLERVSAGAVSGDTESGGFRFLYAKGI